MYVAMVSTCYIVNNNSLFIESFLMAFLWAGWPENRVACCKVKVWLMYFFYDCNIIDNCDFVEHQEKKFLLVLGLNISQNLGQVKLQVGQVFFLEICVMCFENLKVLKVGQWKILWYLKSWIMPVRCNIVLHNKRGYQGYSSFGWHLCVFFRDSCNSSIVLMAKFKAEAWK